MVQQIAHDLARNSASFHSFLFVRRLAAASRSVFRMTISMDSRILPIRPVASFELGYWLLVTMTAIAPVMHS